MLRGAAITAEEPLGVPPGLSASISRERVRLSFVICIEYQSSGCQLAARASKGQHCFPVGWCAWQHHPAGRTAYLTCFSAGVHVHTVPQDLCTLMPDIMCCGLSTGHDDYTIVSGDTHTMSRAW